MHICAHILTRTHTYTLYRRVWTNEEDNAIRLLVGRLGTKSWSVIADHMLREYNIAGRSGKQCRERWHNHLGTSPLLSHIKVIILTTSLSPSIHSLYTLQILI